MSAAYFGLPVTAQFIAVGDLPPTTPYRLRRSISIAPPDLPSGVPPSLKRAAGGTGMLTCCPSPTAFALGLGPTHPASINVAQEPLGYRRPGFTPGFTLLMPAFALPLAPASFTTCLLRRGTLPYPSPPEGGEAAASVSGFSPGILSAQEHSTSELLRTLSRMAASKPTSWLSGHPHIL